MTKKKFGVHPVNQNMPKAILNGDCENEKSSKINYLRDSKLPCKGRFFLVASFFSLRLYKKSNPAISHGYDS
ncbi:MAG: hypothetical protein ABI688_10370, partial [Bacteroidota bacterium]